MKIIQEGCYISRLKPGWRFVAKNNGIPNIFEVITSPTVDDSGIWSIKVKNDAGTRYLIMGNEFETVQLEYANDRSSYVEETFYHG